MHYEISHNRRSPRYSIVLHVELHVIARHAVAVCRLSVHCMQSAKPSAKESILCVYVFSTCIITTFVGKLNSSNDILHVKEIRQTLHGQCCGKGVQNTHTM